MSETFITTPSSPKKQDVNIVGGSVSVDTTGLATTAKQDDIITAINNIPGGGGVQYTEGDTDTTITGTALVWEDAADTLVAASAAKPLPVDVKNSSLAVTGTFWQATQPVSIASAVPVTDNSGSLTVDGTVAISNSSIPVTDNAGSLTVDNAGTFAVQAAQSGNWTLAANSGVDIGDVTINNASGASAVNIQDGGNSITVDGTVTANAGSGTFAVSMATQTPTLATRTSGGLTTYHLVSAATTNATVVKNSAGQLYGWYIYNSNAAARKLTFHNASSTPTAGASVYFSLVIPATSAANVFSDIGLPFSTGISITTVTGLADSDNTAVAANDLIINLWYA